MGILEKLADLVEGSPKVVAAFLVGIITVGAIGGALWIQGLSSSKEAEKSIFEQRLAFAESQAKDKADSLERRIRHLREEVNACKTGFDGILSSISKMENSVSRIRDINAKFPGDPSGGLENAVSEALVAVEVLRGHAAKIDKALATAEALERAAHYDRASLDVHPRSTSRAGARPRRISLLWVLLLSATGLAMLVWILAFSVVRWMRNKRLSRLPGVKQFLRDTGLSVFRFRRAVERVSSGPELLVRLAGWLPRGASPANLEQRIMSDSELAESIGAYRIFLGLKPVQVNTDDDIAESARAGRRPA